MNLSHCTLLCSTLLLAACASNAEKEDSESLLFNPAIQGDALEVSVRSNGCTSADDFYLIVSEELIEIRRIQPDLCRAAPQLVRLSFSYDFSQGLYQFKNETRFSNRLLRR